MIGPGKDTYKRLQRRSSLCVRELSLIYLKEDRKTEAIQLVRESIARQSKMPDDDIDLIWTKVALCRALYKNGEKEKAIELEDAIINSIAKSIRLTTAELWYPLYDLSTASGLPDYIRAEKIHGDTIKILLKRDREQPCAPELARTYRLHAKALHELKKNKEALEEAKSSFEQAKRIADNKESAKQMQELSALYLELKDKNKSALCLKEAELAEKR